MTLRKLRGNVRACVYTEPLWGIPFNLYAPYVSVYMLALGLTDSQIGLIASAGLVFQILWTTLSGAITDKLGRKRTTLISDLISWSIPCLIWALAQNFTYFLIAAIFNSVWRISANSWQCLLVEDTNPDLLVDVYSLIYIAGLLAAFVSPLTGMLINKFSLITTMRGLYLLAFVMMTAKFLILNTMATETQQGLIRLEMTRDQPLFNVVGESWEVLKKVLRRPATMLVAGLMIIVSITNTVNGAFWSILVTEKLQIPSHHLALYPFARSVTMLLFFFFLMPKLRHMEVHKPMILGFVGLLASQIILINVPEGNYIWLVVSTVIEAASIPMTSTLLDKLVVMTVDPQERARIMAILFLLSIICSSPFGWIAGRISEVNRTLPFMMNIIFFTLGALLAFLANRALEKRKEGARAVPNP
ncbi:MAG: MFS transporter [Anaerolineae bacterium]|nr:MFS transporter [Anaerolineae bacterium]